MILGEEEFCTLVEAMPQIVWVTKPDGRNIYFNQRWMDYTGLTLAESLGGAWNKPFHPDDQRQAWEKWQDAVTREARYSLEARLRRADGVYRWWLIRGVPHRDADGKITKWFGTCTDIDDLKMAEQELKQAKVEAVLLEGSQRYSFLADNVPLILWTARPDGCLDYYNKSWFDYTGLNFEQTLNWGWRAAIHPEDLQRCIDRWTLSITTGQDYEIEYRFKRGADGAYRWFLGRASALRNAAGQIIQWVGTGTDIDDQKQAERNLRLGQSQLEERIAERTGELRQSNQALQAEVAQHQFAEKMLLESNVKFRQLTENITDVFWIRSPDMLTVHYVSPAFERIWGRPVASFLAHPERWADFTFPEDRERVLGVFAQLKSDAPSIEMEYRIVRPDGEIRWVRVRGFQVRDAAGVLVRLVGVVADITERKKTEELLQRQTAELQVLFDLIPALIWFKDTHNRVLRVNRRVAEAAGKTVEELEGKAAMENYPEQAAKFYADDLEVIKSGMPKLGIIETIRTPGGKDIWVQTDKVPYRNTEGAVVGIVVMAQDISARRRVEEAQRLEQELLTAVLENVADGILACDAAGGPILFNRALRKLHGLSEQTWPDPKRPDLFELYLPDGKTPMPLEQTPLFRALQEGTVNNIEAVIKPKGQPPRLVLVSGQAFYDNRGVKAGAVVIVHDITERKRFEAQMLQSQKLETVGKLAGGVAHEFNSIMTAILGQSDLLRAELPSHSPLLYRASEIRRAAGRAATLTRQLLAYGRKQFLFPEILHLNSIISDMENSMRHLVGPDIDVRFVLAKELKTVQVDAGQIEQVLLNLTMNAADAMPNGGKLTVETANFTLEQEQVGPATEMKPGGYVLLAVSDTGTGMSDEVKAHAFEPFFTTKGVGQGTGLGLSTCYGIIKQSGGNITIYSEPGRGTTFKIFLPQAEVSAPGPAPATTPPFLPRGRETILLAEDDVAMREMTTTLLRRLGYTVLAAADGLDALNLLPANGTPPVDLLFTDVVMPNMNGPELSVRVHALSPQTKILFASASTENALIHQGVLHRPAVILQKPFTPTLLAHKVRAMLDEAPEANSTPKSA